MILKYKNKLYKIIFLVLICLLPFSLNLGEDKLEAKYLDQTTIGFYQTETCEFSVFEFWRSNSDNKNVIIKNDIVSPIECFGKVNGVDQANEVYYVYIGTNLNINLILQTLIWITLISLIKYSEKESKSKLINLIFLTILFTSQLLSENDFYSYYNKNYNNLITQDNYFLLSIAIGFFIVFKLIDDIFSPRVSSLVNYFPYIFLIVGTFSSSNINFYLLVLSLFGLKNINLVTIKNKYSLIYIFFSIIWLVNINEISTFFDVDKLRGFVSSSNSIGSSIYWILILYLIINGLLYLFKESIESLDIVKLKNSFLISGSIIVTLGTFGAFSTYINYFNFYFFGQNKNGMKTFTSVAGNTWRGFSASAEAIGEFHGIAILLCLYLIYIKKNIRILDILLMCINIYGLYKANNIAAVMSSFLIITYYLLYEKISFKKLKIRFVILFSFIFIFIFSIIYASFNPGISADYEFLSQNLLIEALKNSSYFEYGGNPEVTNLIYQSNYLDIKKLEDYEEKISGTTKIMVNNYISDNNIKFLPSFTSILSISSSLINRTEKWAIFIAKYNPDPTEFLFGSGPFILNNYYFSHQIKTDGGLVLPHSSLLDILIFFGFLGVALGTFFLFKSLLKAKMNIFTILSLFLFLNFLKSDSILYISSFVLLFIFVSLSYDYEVSERKYE